MPVYDRSAGKRDDERIAPTNAEVLVEPNTRPPTRLCLGVQRAFISLGVQSECKYPSDEFL